MTDRPPAFTHVVFDLDGTLVDSRADLAAATNHVLRSFGFAEIEPTTVHAYVGDGARALVAHALGPARTAHLEEGVALFLAYYGRHLLDATRPYPGIATTLRALHARGVALSVLTNKPEGLSRRILEGLDLMRWLRAIVGGDSLPTRKPDPAGLRVVLAQAATAAERLLLVGDSPIDLETARAARVAFCGVGWGLAPEQLRACGPPLLIEHATALLPLVERGFLGIGSGAA